LEKKSKHTLTIIVITIVLISSVGIIWLHGGQNYDLLSSPSPSPLPSPTIAPTSTPSLTPPSTPTSSQMTSSQSPIQTQVTPSAPSPSPISSASNSPIPSSPSPTQTETATLTPSYWSSATITLSPTPSTTLQPTQSLPLYLTDDTGYTLKLTKYPTKIVSLAPANTQILFAVGAGDKVIGVTKYDNYPYNFSAWIAAGNMSSIGSYYNPAVEPIVALNPDLVIAALGSADCAVQLRSMGYNVLTLNPPDIYGVLKNIQLIGNATNHAVDSTALVNSLQQRIDTVVREVKNATTKPKVYDEVYSDPYTSVGKGTFIDNLIKLAGGQNIFENATTAYPKVSSESIIAQNPDLIIFPSNMGAAAFWGTFADVSNRPGWSSINAIINQKLYVVSADAINQPGPRQVDALEALAKILHPEIFGQYINPT
jgi:iron complex transport system substrate-binding protein